MIKLAICDDNKEELNIAKSVIDKYTLKKELIVSAFTNPNDLLSSEEVFDIYILDVIMPAFSGIQVAEQINKINKNSVIIFLSTSSEFAVDSYTVSAFYYLLKPINTKKFYEVLDKSIEKVKATTEKKILIKNHGKFVSVSKNDITYIEVQKDKLFYHLNDNRIIESYGTMKEVMETFNENNFVKPHRSFIVNMKYISSLYSDHLDLVNEICPIPISKNQHSITKEKYLDYMIKKVEE